ncbi:uncharacterized protein SAPINGB_P001025 [Magnusiomyces paraingens]|uniref:Serine/threonine-protein kinase RIO1 n=1 Tax=Magnusiomyces paraingens TaxID=2606893 RepID=A0A5E8B3L7_9ASCO|nr:uncharacterized protein SAPINGB_P001025 [Saprochaete ingens]VVT46058.1 unnamed protein product [Saprochaete ingens]
MTLVNQNTSQSETLENTHNPQVSFENSLENVEEHYYSSDYNDDDDEYFSDEDPQFLDSDFSHDISASSSGSLTQQYNRQRTLLQTKSVPRFNPKGGSASAATVASHELQRARDAAIAKATSELAETHLVEPQSDNEDNNQQDGLSGSKNGSVNSYHPTAEQLALLAARIKIAGSNTAITGASPITGSGGSGGGSSGGSSAKGSARDDRANRATTEQVLDPRTRMILFKMINRGVVFEINGCISTGKEANVYHAMTEASAHRAIKIYKTSILVFKDRDRYVTGEFRFRNGYSKHNPRKMVKLWAEKEFRNLRRIKTNSDIPVPEPLFLRLHVLVMEFLGTKKGWPSPRLRDADATIAAECEDNDDLIDQKFQLLYYQLIAYMRILYQQCKLVHADLSEYNILYHKKKLWIIDVSQSVEHDHPHSLEFLRMDIKNVTDYFRKKGHCPVLFSERRLFQFITSTTLIHTFFSGEEAEKLPHPESIDMKLETTPYLVSVLESLPKENLTEQDLADDAIFREVYIPQNLEQVYDIERDIELVSKGKGKSLIYGDMLNKNLNLNADNDEASHKHDDMHAVHDEENEGNAEKEDDNDDNDEEGDSENNNDDDEEEEDDDDNEDEDSQGRKFKDREANKERKKQLKEEAREKRSKKIKKHMKQKINDAASKKKKKQLKAAAEKAH